MKKRVIIDAVYYMWIAALMLTISDSLMGYFEVFSAKITGKFADNILRGSYLGAGKDILTLGIVIGISVLLIPLWEFYSKTILFRQALRHDKKVIGRFLDKDYLKAMSFDVGEASYRLENDPNTIRWKVINIPDLITIIIVMSLSLIASMFSIDTSYAIICILATVLPVFVSAFTSNITAKYKRQQKEYDGKNRSLEMDLCRNFNFIKLNSLSNVIIDGFKGLFNRYYKKTVVKSVNVNSIADFINSIFDYMADIVVLAFGCYLLSKGGITAGAIAAMFGYLVSIKTIISHIKELINEISELPQCVGRMTELYEYPEKEGTKQLNVITQINIKDLTFGYKKDETVLNGISFSLKRGEKIAIIGANGKGKSTLLKILSSLYSNYKGSIKINDIELKDILKTNLRDKIAYIGQEPYIFRTTVKENVKLGNFTADDERVEKVINKASLYDLKDKVADTEGSNFSGGERQRISIARALIKDFEVLILDEPFNNLDSQGRQLIEDILSEEKRTIIYISHDRKLLDYADNIVAL